MTGKERMTFRIGLVLYVGSFFLIAVIGNEPAPGYGCAYFSLVYPLALLVETLSRGSAFLFEEKIVGYIALLLAGWTNIVFILAVVFGRFSRSRRAFTSLRVVAVALMPFSWVALYEFDAYPREGHFLWLLGMALVLLSGNLPANRAVVKGAYSS
jgi:hypothetical protein